MSTTAPCLRSWRAWGSSHLVKRRNANFALDSGSPSQSGKSLIQQLKSEDVVSSLNAHAERLDKLAPLAAVAKGGFCRIGDIAVTGQMVQVLREDPTIGSVEAAHTYLSAFCDRAQKIASACRLAATTLGSRKGKGGKARYHWYDEFTAVLVDICKQNKIEPNVGIDRVSGEPVGGLVKVASGFERLLLPGMRSRKPATMVKRLQRVWRAPKRSCRRDPLKSCGVLTSFRNQPVSML